MAAQIRDTLDPGQVTTAELVARLSRFDGPAEQFLVSLVALQCHVAQASAGAILRCVPDRPADVLAIHPPLAEGATAPVWLAEAAQIAPEVAGADRTAIKPVHAPQDLYGQSAVQHLILVPLIGGTGVRGVAGFLVRTDNPQRLDESRQRLELTVALMSLYEMRLTLQARGANMARLRAALETLAAMNRQKQFASAAMALCNEVAARWQCQRVSLGVLKGRYVQARAMSHTEKFSRKMDVVRHLEATMEECLDQDLEIIHPASDEAVYVSRAAAEHSHKHGPLAIVSLPLRQGGEVVAVVTAEREAQRPFTDDEVESLRLACELCSPRIMDLERRDRWFGARWAGGLKKGLAFAVGARHTWAKVAAVAVLGLILTGVFVKGDYAAQGPFEFQATEQRIVPAPFAGFLMEVDVKPGRHVEAGVTVLGRLDTRDLELKKVDAEARRSQSLAKAAEAMRDGKTAEQQMAEFEARQIGAEIDLVQSLLDRAVLKAPITGIVVGEDIERLEGIAVEQGKELFRIQPVRRLRAELHVGEDQIVDLLEARQTRRIDERLQGELNTESRPGETMHFTVERIYPVAEVVDGRNVFRVRAVLDEIPEWTRPGMTGLGRIEIDRRPLIWIYTREVIHWLRLKLWI